MSVSAISQSQIRSNELIAQNPITQVPVSEKPKVPSLKKPGLEKLRFDAGRSDLPNDVDPTDAQVVSFWSLKNLNSKVGLNLIQRGYMEDICPQPFLFYDKSKLSAVSFVKDSCEKTPPKEYNIVSLSKNAKSYDDVDILYKINVSKDGGIGIRKNTGKQDWEKEETVTIPFGALDFSLDSEGKFVVNIRDTAGKLQSIEAAFASAKKNQH